MKKLIVYYSYTGHTRYIVDMIKQNIDCDVLELKPKIPYSDDYNTVVDEEQTAASMNKITEIEDTNLDLNQYDEIILGTPVWWYRSSPVVRTFLVKNDLSGKVIKPFATNAGWLGRTFKEIEKLCSNSKVENEMNIVFTEDHTVNELVTSKKEIEEWIKLL